MRTNRSRPLLPPREERAGVFIQWWHGRGLGQRGLAAKIHASYRRLESLNRGGSPLPTPDVAQHYAAFTDIQTYVDQRSYAYAERLLVAVDTGLRTAAPMKTTTEP